MYCYHDNQKYYYKKEISLMLIDGRQIFRLNDGWMKTILGSGGVMPLLFYLQGLPELFITVTSVMGLVWEDLVSLNWESNLKCTTQYRNSTFLHSEVQFFIVSLAYVFCLLILYRCVRLCLLYSFTVCKIYGWPFPVLQTLKVILLISSLMYIQIDRWIYTLYMILHLCFMDCFVLSL